MVSHFMASIPIDRNWFPRRPATREESMLDGCVKGNNRLAGFLFTVPGAQLITPGETLLTSIVDENGSVYFTDVSTRLKKLD